MIIIGDDWAEEHHDVYLMDEAGRRLASTGGIHSSGRVAEGERDTGVSCRRLSRSGDRVFTEM
jgi:hypothetical protein